MGSVTKDLPPPYKYAHPMCVMMRAKSMSYEDRLEASKQCLAEGKVLGIAKMLGIVEAPEKPKPAVKPPVGKPKPRPERIETVADVLRLLRTAGYEAVVERLKELPWGILFILLRDAVVSGHEDAGKAVAEAIARKYTPGDLIYLLRYHAKDIRESRGLLRELIDRMRESLPDVFETLQRSRDLFAEYVKIVGAPVARAVLDRELFGTAIKLFRHLSRVGIDTVTITIEKDKARISSMDPAHIALYIAEFPVKDVGGAEELTVDASVELLIDVLREGGDVVIEKKGDRYFINGRPVERGAEYSLRMEEVAVLNVDGRMFRSLLSKASNAGVSCIIFDVKPPDSIKIGLLDKVALLMRAPVLRAMLHEYDIKKEARGAYSIEYMLSFLPYEWFRKTAPAVAIVFSGVDMPVQLKYTIPAGAGFVHFVMYQAPRTEYRLPEIEYKHAVNVYGRLDLQASALRVAGKIGRVYMRPGPDGLITATYSSAPDFDIALLYRNVNVEAEGAFEPKWYIINADSLATAFELAHVLGESLQLFVNDKVYAGLTEVGAVADEEEAKEIGEACTRILNAIDRLANEHGVYVAQLSPDAVSRWFASKAGRKWSIAIICTGRKLYALHILGRHEVADAVVEITLAQPAQPFAVEIPSEFLGSIAEFRKLVRELAKATDLVLFIYRINDEAGLGVYDRARKEFVWLTRGYKLREDEVKAILKGYYEELSEEERERIVEEEVSAFKTPKYIAWAKEIAKYFPRTAVVEAVDRGVELYKQDVARGKSDEEIAENAKHVMEAMYKKFREYLERGERLQAGTSSYSFFIALAKYWYALYRRRPPI